MVIMRVGRWYHWWWRRKRHRYRDWWWNCRSRWGLICNERQSKKKELTNLLSWDFRQDANIIGLPECVKTQIQFCGLNWVVSDAKRQNAEWITLGALMYLFLLNYGSNHLTLRDPRDTRGHFRLIITLTDRKHGNINFLITKIPYSCGLVRESVVGQMVSVCACFL